MERVGVDVLGLFPVSDSGNHYVLVAMDYYTKWPEAYAVPDQSAATREASGGDVCPLRGSRRAPQRPGAELRVPGLWGGLPAARGAQDEDNAASPPE